MAFPQSLRGILKPVWILLNAVRENRNYQRHEAECDFKRKISLFTASKFVTERKERCRELCGIFILLAGLQLDIRRNSSVIIREANRVAEGQGNTKESENKAAKF